VAIVSAVAVEPEVKHKPIVFKNKDIVSELKRLIIGQNAAIDELAPYLNISMSDLSPEDRPAGVFLLLGPSGVGKTQTVHALAKIIHGSESNVLRIDCGEYQLDHEVAKLIGAPPGYLGHKETHPALSQQKLNAATSERSPISIVLFDEIEKAAPSFDRILLGVLDRGVLKLGDNTSANFTHSLIFMTSNLGSSEMNRAASGHSLGLPIEKDKTAKPTNVGVLAAKKRFSPEFLGRVDQVITYKTLTIKDIDKILDMQLDAMRAHLKTRLGVGAFDFKLTKRARKFILDHGYSHEYGVRDLRKLMQTGILASLAPLVGSHLCETITLDLRRDKLVVVEKKAKAAE
jgi:ATP-dependent Clp protease ATP-binding subunit ClpA